MNQNINNSIVTYKENISKSSFNTIVTRLKIIRDRLFNDLLIKEICQKYRVSKNTIPNIFKKLKEDVDKKYRTLDALSKDYTKEELLKYFSGLDSKSTAPVTHPKMATIEQEALILMLFEETNYGMNRMKTDIRRSLSQCDGRNKFVRRMKSLKEVTLSQIRGVYKRNKLKVKKVKTARGPRVPLYNYNEIGAFEYLHYDTKTIPDKSALPIEIYNKFKNKKELPIIEWNIIDVKTRTRFLAYSHNRSSEFGFHFLTSVIQFIRGTFPYLNDMKITVGMDNGCEFCMGSERKLKEWNDMFKPLNTHLYAYEPGKDVRKNLIERSHLSDDQEFFVPRAKFINDRKSFLIEAKKYATYWNDKRGHSGIGMKGLTPIQKLQKSGIYNAKKILAFPTMILEETLGIIKQNSQILQVIYQLDKIKKENKKYDMKKIINSLDPYKQFFYNDYAQNVLTQYPLGIKKN